MHNSKLRSIRFAAAILALGACAVAAAAPDSALKAAIANPGRTAKFVARDPVRHPLEELTFFGLKPNMTVVELWPGGGYWTEILGPFLAKTGTYYVALESTEGSEGSKSVSQWRSRVAAEKDRLGTIHETTLAAGHFDIAPAGSADAVLTFRNLHNWMDGGYADQALAACFTALKPGGILGIEEHRGRTDKPQDPKAADGYVREDYTIALAKNWPDGVWTLPPTLSQGDKDRAKYVAIGEADNFVLKFRKPQ
jgi:predicted methyltransferase